MSSQHYPARRKKSAAERREQQLRANARMIGRVMKTCTSLLEHRGCEPTTAHAAIAEALNAVHQNPTKKICSCPLIDGSQPRNSLQAEPEDLVVNSLNERSVNHSEKSEAADARQTCDNGGEYLSDAQAGTPPASRVPLEKSSYTHCLSPTLGSEQAIQEHSLSLQLGTLPEAWARAEDNLECLKPGALVLSDTEFGDLHECSLGIVAQQLSDLVYQVVFKDASRNALHCLIVPAESLCIPREDDRAPWEVELDRMSFADQDESDFEDASSHAAWENEFEEQFPDWHDEPDDDNDSRGTWEREHEVMYPEWSCDDYSEHDSEMEFQ